MISYDNNLLIRVLYVTTHRREMGDVRERVCVDNKGDGYYDEKR